NYDAQWLSDTTVLYTNNFDGIYKLNVNTGISEVLFKTNGYVLDHNPAVHGNKLAFIEHYYETFFSLRLKDIDGTNNFATLFKGNSAFNEHMGLVWTPDGRKLIFFSQVNGGLIYVYDVFVRSMDTISLQDLGIPMYMRMLLSPDGQKIAIGGHYVVNIDGTGFSQMNENIYQPLAYAWSWDSQYIIASPWNQDVYIYSVDGSKGYTVKDVTRKPYFINGISWRPQGDKKGVIVGGKANSPIGSRQDIPSLPLMDRSISSPMNLLPTMPVFAPMMFVAGAVPGARFVLTALAVLTIITILGKWFAKRISASNADQQASTLVLFFEKMKLMSGLSVEMKEEKDLNNFAAFSNRPLPNLPSVAGIRYVAAAAFFSYRSPAFLSKNKGSVTTVFANRPVSLKENQGNGIQISIKNRFKVNLVRMKDLAPTFVLFPQASSSALKNDFDMHIYSMLNVIPSVSAQGWSFGVKEFSKILANADIRYSIEVGSFVKGFPKSIARTLHLKFLDSSIKGSPLLNLASAETRQKAEDGTLHLYDVVKKVRPQIISFHLGFSVEAVVVNSKTRDFEPASNTFSAMTQSEVFDSIAATTRAIFEALKNLGYKKNDLLLENLVYSENGAFEHVCNPYFIRSVWQETEYGALVDFGHAFVSAKLLGYDPKDYIKIIINKDNISHLREVHIAVPGYDQGKKQWRDQHNCFSSDTGSEANQALRSMLYYILDLRRVESVSEPLIVNFETGEESATRELDALNSYLCEVSSSVLSFFRNWREIRKEKRTIEAIQFINSFDEKDDNNIYISENLIMNDVYDRYVKTGVNFSQFMEYAAFLAATKDHRRFKILPKLREVFLKLPSKVTRSSLYNGDTFVGITSGSCFESDELLKIINDIESSLRERNSSATAISSPSRYNPHKSFGYRPQSWNEEKGFEYQPRRKYSYPIRERSSKGSENDQEKESEASSEQENDPQTSENKEQQATSESSSNVKLVKRIEAVVPRLEKYAFTYIKSCYLYDHNAHSKLSRVHPAAIYLPLVFFLEGGCSSYPHVEEAIALLAIILEPQDFEGFQKSACACDAKPVHLVYRAMARSEKYHTKKASMASPLASVISSSLRRFVLTTIVLIAMSVTSLFAQAIPQENAQLDESWRVRFLAINAREIKHLDMISIGQDVYDTVLRGQLEREIVQKRVFLEKSSWQYQEMEQDKEVLRILKLVENAKNKRDLENIVIGSQVFDPQVRAQIQEHIVSVKTQLKNSQELSYIEEMLKFSTEEDFLKRAGVFQYMRAFPAEQRLYVENKIARQQRVFEKEKEYALAISRSQGYLSILSDLSQCTNQQEVNSIRIDWDLYDTYLKQAIRQAIRQRLEEIDQEASLHGLEKTFYAREAFLQSAMLYLTTDARLSLNISSDNPWLERWIKKELIAKERELVSGKFDIEQEKEVLRFYRAMIDADQVDLLDSLKYGPQITSLEVREQLLREKQAKRDLLKKIEDRFREMEQWAKVVDLQSAIFYANAQKDLEGFYVDPQVYDADIRQWLMYQAQAKRRVLAQDEEVKRVEKKIDSAARSYDLENIFIGKAVVDLSTYKELAAKISVRQQALKEQERLRIRILELQGSLSVRQDIRRAYQTQDLARVKIDGNVTDQKTLQREILDKKAYFDLQKSLSFLMDRDKEILTIRSLVDNANTINDINIVQARVKILEEVRFFDGTDWARRLQQEISIKKAEIEKKDDTTQKGSVNIFMIFFAFLSQPWQALKRYASRLLSRRSIREQTLQEDDQKRSQNDNILRCDGFRIVEKNVFVPERLWKDIVKGPLSEKISLALRSIDENPYCGFLAREYHLRVFVSDRVPGAKLYGYKLGPSQSLFYVVFDSQKILVAGVIYNEFTHYLSKNKHWIATTQHTIDRFVALHRQALQERTETVEIPENKQNVPLRYMQAFAAQYDKVEFLYTEKDGRAYFVIPTSIQRVKDIVESKGFRYQIVEKRSTPTFFILGPDDERIGRFGVYDERVVINPCHVNSWDQVQTIIAITRLALDLKPLSTTGRTKISSGILFDRRSWFSADLFSERPLSILLFLSFSSFVSNHGGEDKNGMTAAFFAIGAPILPPQELTDNVHLAYPVELDTRLKDTRPSMRIATFKAKKILWKVKDFSLFFYATAPFMFLTVGAQQAKEESKVRVFAPLSFYPEAVLRYSRPNVRITVFKVKKIEWKVKDFSLIPQALARQDQDQPKLPRDPKSLPLKSAPALSAQEQNMDIRVSRPKGSVITEKGDLSSKAPKAFELSHNDYARAVASRTNAISWHPISRGRSVACTSAVLSDHFFLTVLHKITLLLARIHDRFFFGSSRHANERLSALFYHALSEKGLWISKYLRTRSREQGREALYHETLKIIFFIRKFSERALGILRHERSAGLWIKDDEAIEQQPKNLMRQELFVPANPRPMAAMAEGDPKPEFIFSNFPVLEESATPTSGQLGAKLGIDAYEKGSAWPQDNSRLFVGSLASTRAASVFLSVEQALASSNVSNWKPIFHVSGQGVQWYLPEYFQKKVRITRFGKGKNSFVEIVDTSLSPWDTENKMRLYFPSKGCARVVLLRFFSPS
ncbi:MAG TPA: DUF692 family protein, partial [Candidatus Omnitrophota bacterium]|nr:DUF692 family protein [Candidatus Omnitrophota bacterium]